MVLGVGPGNTCNCPEMDLSSGWPLICGTCLGKLIQSTRARSNRLIPEKEMENLLELIPALTYDVECRNQTAMLEIHMMTSTCEEIVFCIEAGSTDVVISSWTSGCCVLICFLSRKRSKESIYGIQRGLLLSLTRTLIILDPLSELALTVIMSLFIFCA